MKKISGHVSCRVLRPVGGGAKFRILLTALSAVIFMLQSVEARNVSISGSRSEPVELEKSISSLPGPAIKVKRNEGRKSGFGVDRDAGLGHGNQSIGLSGKFMVLNFESAPIREIIKNICEMLNMNYIIEPGVEGVVTVRTLNKIPLSSALEILDQLLVINGITRVKIGDYWRFLPVGKSFQEPRPIYMDQPASRFVAQDRFQIQIISFSYISAQEAASVLQPFMSNDAVVIPLPRLNMLILIERGVKMEEIATLIKAIDVDSLDSMQIKLFEINNTDVFAVYEEIVPVFTALGYKVGVPGDGIIFLPVFSLNAMLVINPYPNIYPAIKSWIEKLDTGFVVTDTEVSTFIYAVQNGDASTLAGILNSLYSSENTFDGAAGHGALQSSPPAFIQPAVATAIEESSKFGAKKAESVSGEKSTGKSDKKPKAVPAKTKAAEPINIEPRIDTREIVGEVLILAYPDTNSIIVRTSKRNYPMILDTLKALDLMPQQVLIEVLITELELSDSLEFGLEWAVKQGTGTFARETSGGSMAQNLGDSTFTRSGIGFSFFTHPTPKIMMFLKALAAESKLEVRASPALMTSNNKSASIDITNEVPISTVTTTSSGGEIQNIQYKSVGIRLSVKPKINRKKYVSLEINQEISQIDDSRRAEFSDAVPLLRRQARTSVVVKDRDTLIIGGMINERTSKGSAGVPGLHNIPLIGWLFGTETRKVSKTELLILITPHVVTNSEEAVMLTEEYREKIKNMKDSFRSSKAKKRRSKRLKSRIRVKVSDAFNNKIDNK